MWSAKRNRRSALLDKGRICSWVCVVCCPQFLVNLYLCLVEENYKRFFIEIAYKGTLFHGWQIQNNALSVQELINKALSTVFRQPVLTVGCGRTDAGVHARQLFAHFDLQITPEHKEEFFDFTSGSKRKEQVVRGLNALLPLDIVVLNIFEVALDSHARFDAISREYSYLLHKGKNPFLTDYSWQIRSDLNLERMNAAAKIMMQYRDFSCFSKSNTQVFTNNCTIYSASWTALDSSRYQFEIRANRFLRNMVRAIVGTLVEIGKEEHPVEYMHEVLKSKSRAVAGASVPACGLYLTKVNYPEGYLPDVL